MWIKSHLPDRYQFFQCGAAESESLEVKHGVSQSLILWTLLFLIHINDLTRSMKYCRTQICADDNNYNNNDIPLCIQE